VSESAPSAGSETRVDVVVPVYNKLVFLPEAVGSIVDAVNAHGAARLWLVDNGSTDGSYEWLVERFSRSAYILRLSAGTISAVRNFGAKQGDAPIISFIDCDCLIPLEYFNRLESVLAETRADATGCKVILPSDPTWVEAVWNRMHDDGSSGPRKWINSANFAVRRPIFARVSGFDEHLETGEDAEVCLRIRQAGGTLLEDSRLAVAHLDNAKTLPAFFRKERWRGLGMLGTVSWHSVDKPAAMTIAHLFAIIAAVAALVWLRTNVWARAAIVIALMFAVPAVTVVYRRRSSIASFSFLRATVLYQLYYLARINALVIIVSRMIRRRSR